MRRVAPVLGAIALIACPSTAFAAFHLGSDALWTDITEGAGAQAAMWLGDMGSVVMLVIGAALLMLVIGAIVGMVNKQ